MNTNLKIASIVVLAVVISSSAIAAETTKLDLGKPPRKLIVGTPKPSKSSNLERKAVIPEILVPAGTTNLAADMVVTGSDDFPVIGELEYITDGDKDGADGSYVELGPGIQWVQIDLGAKKTIYAIALWHYHKDERVYRDVIIHVADDADFTKNVQTLFNNDHDNSAGLGIGKDKEYIEINIAKLIDAKGVKGQFIRLYSAGSTHSDMNHYIEVEVFGK